MELSKILNHPKTPNVLGMHTLMHQQTQSTPCTHPSTTTLRSEPPTALKTAPTITHIPSSTSLKEAIPTIVNGHAFPRLPSHPSISSSHSPAIVKLPAFKDMLRGIGVDGRVKFSMLRRGASSTLDEVARGVRQKESAHVQVMACMQEQPANDNVLQVVKRIEMNNDMNHPFPNRHYHLQGSESTSRSSSFGPQKIDFQEAQRQRPLSLHPLAQPTPPKLPSSSSPSPLPSPSPSSLSPSPCPSPSHTHLNNPLTSAYSCLQCHKTFDKKWRLDSHVRVFHRNIRRFGCDQCHKRFPYPSDLKKHRREVHLGIRPHSCNICHKGFAAQSKLKAHKDSVHFKKRPHICCWTQCGKRFGYKSDLTKHLRKLHGATQEDVKKLATTIRN